MSFSDMGCGEIMGLDKKKLKHMDWHKDHYDAWDHAYGSAGKSRDQYLEEQSDYYNQNLNEDITPEQQKELTSYFEDMMINDWIKSEKALTFAADAGNTPYDSLTASDQDALNEQVFNFYNQIYTDMIVEDQNSPNITFENFVLLYNPEKDFKSDLLNFSLGSKESDATVWQDSFGTNTDLHKASALKGYQNSLVEMGAAIEDG